MGSGPTIRRSWKREDREHLHLRSLPCSPSEDELSPLRDLRDRQYTRRRRGRHSLIYAIRNTRTRSVKLGYSAEPARRVKGLQTATEDELVLEAYVHGQKKLEEAFHKALEHERVRGEWFNGSGTETVVWFLRLLEQRAEDEVKGREIFIALLRFMDAPLADRTKLVEWMQSLDWEQPQDPDALAMKIDEIMGWAA